MPIVFLAGLAWRHRWVAEDAFIDFRVVDNLHHGLGPVWNAGERVEAFTSPLWVGILWLSSSMVTFVALEWLAVILGGLATLIGLAAAARGSWLLWRGTGRSGVALPLGLLVIVALPPMWDFTTSGLETGLTFSWLGSCFWALAALTQVPRRPAKEIAGRWRRPKLTPTVAAVIIGLGPLVRPDLAIFSLGFLIVLVVFAVPERRLARLRLVGWTLLLPLDYEIFRMGYFGALEPNTALAKEAASADWSRGWAYLKDFVDPYLLFIPLGLLCAYAIFEFRRRLKPQPGALALVLAAVLCGLLHAIYIVRVGGDFMHGRMLLPSLFGVLLPVAVVRTPSLAPKSLTGNFRAWLLLIPATAVILWALVCAATLRTSYANTQAQHATIADERSNYVIFSRNPHPITLNDYRLAPWAREGWELRRLAEHGRALVLHVPYWYAPLTVNGTPRASSPTPVVAGALPVGMLGYAAGPNVHIVDQLGLADPLTARTRLSAFYIPSTFWPVPVKPTYRYFPPRTRAGHEKYLPTEWLVARFGPPGLNPLPGVPLLSASGIAAARHVLTCPPMRRLLTAITAPLTFGRFLSNIGDSFSLTSLRFSSDPNAAARELCSQPTP